MADRALMWNVVNRTSPPCLSRKAVVEKTDYVVCRSIAPRCTKNPPLVSLSSRSYSWIATEQEIGAG